MPEIFLVKADKLVVYDNINKSTQVIINADPSKHSYEEVLKEIEVIISSLKIKIDTSEASYKEPSELIDFESNFTKKNYLNAVNIVKKYIEEGDVMQVVLAQDFSSPFNKNPFDLYKAVRKLNPSPYMYYLDLQECKGRWIIT
jgi:anthranilate synthase component 1